MEDGNMANYTTSTSDKSRDRAVKLLLCGGIGLHYFYVGRIKAGLIHAALGIVMWLGAVGMIIEGAGSEKLFSLWIIFLLACFNVPDLIRLKLGKFRDNVGDYLRQ
jgi:hypothetical protein